MIAVLTVTTIKLQKGKTNMAKLINSMTVQSSSEITVKRDLKLNREYENIEICDHKAATKTVDIEINENPVYSTVKDL